MVGTGTVLFYRLVHHSAAVRDVQRPPDSIVDTYSELTPVTTVSPIHGFEKSAYTSTLDEHTLVAMENTWSNISFILMDLSDPLMSHLVRAVSKLTQLFQQHQNAYASYLDGAIVIQRRLGDASSNIRHLRNHYNSTNFTGRNSTRKPQDLRKLSDFSYTFWTAIPLTTCRRARISLLF